MTALTEGRYPGDFLVSEAPGTLSRDDGTVDVPAATTTMEPGTVLGQLSATGHWVPYDDAASDGSEVAAGILYGPRLENDTGAISSQAATIVTRLAEVRDAGLIWGAGVDETAGLAGLAALFIVAR